jgi:hypothetical protein
MDDARLRRRYGVSAREDVHEPHASEQMKCPGDEDGLNESVGGEVFR